jgi:hypothetical protein
MPDLDELVYWADIIDGRSRTRRPRSNSKNRHAADARDEASHSRELIHKIIRLLQQKPLAAVIDVNRKFVRPSIDWHAHHTESIEIMRSAARCTGGV